MGAGGGGGGGAAVGGIVGANKKKANTITLTAGEVFKNEDEYSVEKGGKVSCKITIHMGYGVYFEERNAKNVSEHTVKN